MLWSPILNDSLCRLPYYHGLLPIEDAVAMLKKEGDFIVRTSVEFSGDARSFVLSTVFEGVARHYIFKMQNGLIALDFKRERGFGTIQEFVDAHLRTSTPICTDINVLLKRPIGRQEWELSHSAIKKGEELGSGAFGVVRTGSLKLADGTTKRVAIKESVQSICSNKQIKEFMNEARVMRRFKHPNVIFCYGVAFGQEPLMIVMDLATEGALKDHLKLQRRGMEAKLYMCLGAASGLNYVHERNVVHCDIAARNCLFSGNEVKIADFGLARELENNEKEIRVRQGQKVPIKYLPPDALIERAFTKKSDVWAFGVLCWKIFADGMEPYNELLDLNLVAKKIIEGQRLNFRENTPEKFCKFVNDCVWNKNAKIRCEMRQAKTWLEKNVPELCGRQRGSSKSPERKDNNKNSREKSKQRKKSGK